MTKIWNVTTINSNNLSLDILPNIGGRLWDISYKGTSLLFKNEELVGQPVDIEKLDQLPTKSPQFGFPLWGGEKTWVAPDNEWLAGAPFPVLDSAPYRVTKTNNYMITMQSEICPLSGLQIVRKITLLDDHSWTIDHEIINNSARKKFVGIWSVLMLKRPCRISLTIDEEKGVVPVFGDGQGEYEIVNTKLIARCDRPKEYKIGMNNSCGKVHMEYNSKRDKINLTCETIATSSNSKYAHGHDFEIFNSNDYEYCEVEWHSPADTITPNESINYRQNFTIQETTYQTRAAD
jgi:hypothetical protein